MTPVLAYPVLTNSGVLRQTGSRLDGLLIRPTLLGLTSALASVLAESRGLDLSDPVQHKQAVTLADELTMAIGIQLAQIFGPVFGEAGQPHHRCAAWLTEATVPEISAVLQMTAARLDNGSEASR